MSAREAPLERGTRVGDFVVEHLIGSGGVAMVYLAIDPRFGKRAAVKVLRRAHAGDEAAVERFNREARAASELDHPGIVEVFGFGYLDDRRPYLVMSFLEGESLREVLAREGTLTEARAWAHLRDVASALAYAHARGVVHRDVKPDNLFVHRGVTRLLDFGVANLDVLWRENPEAEALAKLTQAGTPVGTPGYMAPEQWWGEPPIPATDQYAFGVTLFELLSGRLPFVGTQFTALLQAHLHDAPPALATLLSDTRPEVDAFVARLMAKKPEDRFPSFDAVIAEGDRLFASSSDVAHPQRRDAPPSLATTTSTTPIVVALGMFAAGIGALVATGYSGPRPHAVHEWVRDAGWGAIGILLGAIVGLWLVARGVRARAEGRAVPIAASAGVLLPLVAGVYATVQSWSTVMAHARGREPGNAFMVLHQGMHETSTSRFMGFGLGAALALALFAGLRAAKARLVAPSGVRLGVAVVFTAAAVASAPFAPAVTLPLVIAALVFVLRSTFADATVDLRAHGQSLYAGTSAIAFATLVAWTKLDAARAYVWVEHPTRSVRIATLLRFEAVLGVVLAASAVALVVFVVSEVSFARRRGLRLRALLFAAVAVAVPLALDLTFYARFQAARAASAAPLSETFALFANLSPPIVESDRLVVPQVAPALHVTRDTIALGGQGIARIAALESPDVRQNVLREISHAVAAERFFGGPDLSVVVDGRLPYTVAARVLGLARQAGALNVELLLLRGEAVEIPPGAPAELAQLLPTDFAALPVRLELAKVDEAETFAAVVSSLQRSYVDDPLVLPVRD